jgi:LPS-assembly protein
VDLTRGDQHLLADKASYDKSSGTLDAQGNVVYRESALAFASDTAMMNLNSSEARLRKALFIAGDGPIRGSADAIYRDNPYLTRIHEAAVSSCPPGNQDWVMHASRLKINRESGQGSAKNAWLEFKSVPILYTPYISFPTDNRRLSGFLSPTWGHTQRGGFYVSAPFYWNIAPNYDTVITPRYFSSRGEMLSNNFRYLSEYSKGSFGAEYMPNDRIFNKPRYSFSLKDVSTLDSKLNWNLNLNLVSDNNYFNDLNTALGFNRSSYLPSTAYINYSGTNVGVSGSIYHYQSVDPTLLKNNYPYDVLPKLSLNLHHAFENMPLDIRLDNQFADFRHSTLVNGQRLVLWPSVALPFASTAGFFTPKISVQSTQYQLTNQTIGGQPSSINRTLPIFSVDSGMSFEKNLVFDNSSYTNLIEPRLFYLFIPRKDQTAIPIFDTTAYDNTFNSLFRENSYSGFDRLQDANQITLAATSRLINNTNGLETIKASLGQIFYFQNRTVLLPGPYSTDAKSYLAGVPVQTSKTSNLIGEVSGQIDSNLSYTTGAQWNPANNSLARGQALLKYRSQPNILFDVGYRYRSASANPLLLPTLVPGSTNALANISMTDVSFRWPLFDQWYAMGRWQYSLNFDKTVESFIGLEKENCCWRFRIIGRRFINGASSSINAANVAPQTAFFIELELKGLSGIGDDVDYFLQTVLNGYRPASYYN